MADHIASLREPLEAIEAALAQPEGWSLLIASSTEAARFILDAASLKARELRRQMVSARAAKEEAAKEMHAAAARETEYAKLLADLEDNLVRPICQEFGKGKTHELDTGFARVALCRKPGRLVLSASAKSMGEADVVAMLPPELVRVPPPEPDRKAIRDAIATGQIVPGFEIETGATRVDWRG